MEPLVRPELPPNCGEGEQGGVGGKDKVYSWHPGQPQGMMSPGMSGAGSCCSSGILRTLETGLPTREEIGSLRSMMYACPMFPMPFSRVVTLRRSNCSQKGMNAPSARTYVSEPQQNLNVCVRVQFVARRVVLELNTELSFLLLIIHLFPCSSTQLHR